MSDAVWSAATAPIHHQVTIDGSRTYISANGFEKTNRCGAFSSVFIDVPTDASTDFDRPEAFSMTLLFTAPVSNCVSAIEGQGRTVQNRRLRTNVITA